MKFEIGDTIGAYRLNAECGQGAYGKVFLAESMLTHRRVALKVVFRHGRSCERELRGLAVYQEVCRRTDLLQIYHVEDCGEYFYYTMDAADDLNAGNGEYVSDTLANRLRASGKLSAGAVRRMAEELAACLHTLHDKGVLHRDVKPDNILWIDGEAKLGDIGLVTADGSTRLAGTPGFLPPEVLAGAREYEKQDDFYALGKVVYCALTGNPVEEYPSFPDSRTLGDCGDLVLLYNRLCGGELPDDVNPKKRPRRIYAAWIAAAVALASVCGAAAWFVLHLKPVETPAAAPETVSVPSEPSPPATSEDDIRGKRSLEIDRMVKKYAMSAEFENIRPRAIRDYEDLCLARHCAGQPEYAPPVSREPPIRLSSDHEDAMRIVKFDRQHENDPVWMFGKLSEAIEADLKSLRDISDDTSVDDDFFGLLLEKFENSLRRRKKLETVLLRKYRNEAPAQAAP